jgi:mono/diheme cytochrome c family protein
LAAAAVLAVAAAPAAAQTVSDAAATVESGRRAYTTYCARCHGINLAVGSSAFFDLRTFPKDDKARFVRSVTYGLRAMPAWEGIVKPEQIDSIWAYIGSVNGW